MNRYPEKWEPRAYCGAPEDTAVEVAAWAILFVVALLVIGCFQ
jgi:hypothetical protein